MNVSRALRRQHLQRSNKVVKVTVLLDRPRGRIKRRLPLARQFHWKATARPPWKVREENRRRDRVAKQARKVNRVHS